MADLFTPVGPDDEDRPARSGLGMRLLWFAMIALASVAAVATLAYLLRALIV